MKRFGYLLLVLMMVLLCTGCAREEEEKKDSFAELKEEISVEMEAAKGGKYENLNILCDEVRLPESEEIKEMRFPVYTFTKEMSLLEKLKFYKDTVFPKVMDMESVEERHIVDMYSLDFETRKYAIDYAYMLEHAEELEDTVLIGYAADEFYKVAETIPEGVCFNLALGTLGNLMKKDSPFLASSFEEVKTYSCNMDDLSDSYLLMDGTQKTVAEAKFEIETYLDAHYPVVGEDNGIRNEVYEITVRKILNTEYYIFDASRTLSYEKISVNCENGDSLRKEVVVAGNAVLCESNKVDLLVGFVNCFDKGSVTKVYEEYLPFAEVMEIVSFYMTKGTTFDIRDIAIEYRMFSEVVEERVYYNWIPYWSFLVENPNDNSVIRVYIDIETGDIESYQR